MMLFFNLWSYILNSGSYIINVGPTIALGMRCLFSKYLAPKRPQQRKGHTRISEITQDLFTK